MVNFATLRAQHHDALAMADRLIELVEHRDPRSAAIPILMQVNRLLGLLRVHFAYEDVELYATLAVSPDPAVARIAQRFVDEMGKLASDFECFARRWSCSVSIAAHINEFRQEAHAMLLALAARIERENQQLFPLAEALAELQQRKVA